LGERCFDASNIAPQQMQPAWLLELATLLLQTQMKALLAQVASLGKQLIRAHLDDLFHFHGSLATVGDFFDYVLLRSE